MPTPDTWAAYYRRAAAMEAALGNDKPARTYLRYARIEDARATLSPVIGTQDADHLAGGVRVPGLSSAISYNNHNGGIAR